jgi:hypothetical protein
MRILRAIEYDAQSAASRRRCHLVPTMMIALNRTPTQLSTDLKITNQQMLQRQRHSRVGTQATEKQSVEKDASFVLNSTFG